MKINSTPNITSTYKAAGKLMLFGEYLVMSGADSLAFPLKFNQTLQITPIEDGIFWESFARRKRWLSIKFKNDLSLAQTNHKEATGMLQNLLQLIHRKNPGILSNQYFKTEANFEPSWGIGSSSTLISLLSQWSKIDPFYLLESTFGGSGYDIACATSDYPIIFTDKKIKETVYLSDKITKNLLFVYSGKKQSSREELVRLDLKKIAKSDVDAMNKMIEIAISTEDIVEFEKIMMKSENMLSPILNLQPIQSLYFQDYPFAVKSLGAWGGDFFLASFRDENKARSYFKNKGYLTAFTFKEIAK